MLQSPRSMRLVWASSYRQHACRISAAGSDHTAEGNARRLHQKVFQKPNARPRTLSIVDGGLRKKRSFLAGRGTSAMETLRSVRLAPCRGFQVCALLESGRVAAGVPSLPVARVTTEPCLTEPAFRWSPAREPCTSICQ